MVMEVHARRDLTFHARARAQTFPGVFFPGQLFPQQQHGRMITYQHDEQAAALGMDRVILETDAATVAKALSDPTTDRPAIGILMAEIKTQMIYEFSACIISHVPTVVML
jgi:hypothetical protein